MSQTHQTATEHLSAFLRALRAGTPRACGNLVLVPIYGPSAGPQVDTLTKAITKQTAAVTEVSEAGRVNQLQVTNSGELPLLILDNEELIGAKQNRTVNATIVVATGSVLNIPVTCVEAGRWRYRSRGFASAQRVSSPSMRNSKYASVTESLSSTRTYVADQAQTWADVDKYSRRRGTSSATSSLSDALDADRTEIEAFVRELRPEAGQTGMVAYVNGHLVSIDVLGRPEPYEEMHPSLVRSCAIEAIDRSRERRHSHRARPESAIAALAASACAEFRSTGLGTDVRFHRNRLRGSALVTDDGVVHLAAFRA